MGSPELTDADLVSAALAGDKESLGCLIQRHWPTANFLAARVLGSPELARDAAQEAAIAAMTGLHRLRSPDRFGAWFCGITLNVARRWLRQLHADQLRTELPADVAQCPAEAAETADVAARVRAAIALLADGQRNAVRLFYLQGLSHREVAAELGISPAAVKARLHQARVALAPKLTGTIDLPEAHAMTTNDPTTPDRWVDATVTEIRLAHDDHDEPHHIMVLAESEGSRSLPIWIGPAEATGLALLLESTEMPRPFTYQLAASLVAAAGASIEQVRVTRIEAGVFYATVLVTSGAGTREVDARPSDAVNLALAAGAPIRVDNTLWDVRPPVRTLDLADLPVVTADMAAEHAERMRAILTPPTAESG